MAETGRLMAGLRRVYGDAARVLEGDAASEAAFKREASGHAIVHLASHGIVDPAYPLYSHVLLAPGDAVEDGRLEARELMTVALDTDLLVLSACETGRGAIRRGEGVVGLAWAATQAGARAVIVSQWAVDAASTTDLMLVLHRRLAAGRGPAAALRAAMLVTSRDSRYRHPFYWAGFVAIGSAHRAINAATRSASQPPRVTPG
jgi:CHAT domain-containing protein